MELAAIFNQYVPAFTEKYGPRMLAQHHSAIQSILRCRTSASGEFQLRCSSCEQVQSHPLSCGHRFCPKCQNEEAAQWLERQQAKLLPVEYFMVTFTLPKELRDTTWYNQEAIYAILFACVTSTLKDFGLNPNLLGGDIGMTIVLHTHTRSLDYHPHLHVVVPGGGVDKDKRQWKKTKGKYLFNEFKLADVFRARFLDAMNEAKIFIPVGVPKKWVADCTHVGNGLPALKYLSRYLYRGVIREKNIVRNEDGNVTFRYKESKTKLIKTRTLKGEDFMWLVLMHVLPKGFRRARDYGFLHGNAKKLLSVVQLVLRALVPVNFKRPPRVFICPHCQSPMCFEGIRRPQWQSG